jgi:[ribosomal protein S5]-alanine N-acetyltransferase
VRTGGDVAGSAAGLPTCTAPWRYGRTAARSRKLTSADQNSDSCARAVGFSEVARGEGVNAPERVETDRLVLRRPAPADACAIYARYSSDPEVTRYLAWPRHNVLDDTCAFIQFSDAEWQRWPAGPYLIEARDGGTLLGSTGLGFEAPERAATGYVLARDSWGRGYATEALQAIVAIAGSVAVRRLYALCHPEHAASRRVLEKCGFTCEATLPQYAEFPNLRPGERSDVLCYSRPVREGDMITNTSKGVVSHVRT